MEHETTTIMFATLYKDFSFFIMEQICFYVPKKHSIFTEMEHETTNTMFTTFYKALSCSKVEHRNETQNHNHNVCNALQGFFLFHYGTYLLFFDKKTLLEGVDL